jgi:FKBP-type peptidyl-prolyl cis-trans isomerase
LRGGDGDAGQGSSQQSTPQPAQSPQQPRKTRQADSTDAISSALTRRFGLAGGLAWLGFLTFGVVSEQIKTRLEVAAEERDTKSVAQRTLEKVGGTTITYSDEKIGGGARPQQGDLVVLNMKGYAIVDGEKQLFVDTSDTGKPIVLVYKSRPFTAGNSLGVELALEDMRAGGRRHVNVPSQYGFGEKGTSLKPSRHVPDKASVVPPNADLEYDVELLRVSIPPS